MPGPSWPGGWPNCLAHRPSRVGVPCANLKCRFVRCRLPQKSLLCVGFRLLCVGRHPGQAPSVHARPSDLPLRPSQAQPCSSRQIRPYQRLFIAVFLTPRIPDARAVSRRSIIGACTGHGSTSTPGAPCSALAIAVACRQYRPILGGHSCSTVRAEAAYGHMAKSRPPWRVRQIDRDDVGLAGNAAARQTPEGPCRTRSRPCRRAPRCRRASSCRSLHNKGRLRRCGHRRGGERLRGSRAQATCATRSSQAGSVPPKSR